MIACIVLFAMMLLTVFDVCFRYFLDDPISGVTELTEILMACLSFLGLAWCAIKDQHLKVDLLISRLHPRTQGMIDTTMLLLGLCLVSLISWRIIAEAAALYHLKITSSLLNVPVYPFYIIASMGCAMLCLVMIGIILQNISKVIVK